MLSAKRKIRNNREMMATQMESYVNFRWEDNGSSNRNKTIHLQSTQNKDTPLIFRRLVGASDGAVKDFVVNRADYKRQYLRFVHLCCEEDISKDEGEAPKFLLDLFSKAMQKVLVQRLKDCELQEGSNGNVKLLYEISIRVYKCKNFEYPNNEEWDLYDGVLLSGSRYARQRNNDLWVIRLKDEIGRKIISHKRKTLVVSLGQDQTNQEVTNDKPLFNFQNLCHKPTDSAGDINVEKKEQNEDDEGTFMVRIQATQEYKNWSKEASSLLPTSPGGLTPEKGETSEEARNSTLDQVADTCEKFGWFPSVDTYRVLSKRVVSNSSFATLGSYGSMPSIAGSVQFYKNFTPRNANDDENCKTNL